MSLEESIEEIKIRLAEADLVAHHMITREQFTAFSAHIRVRLTLQTNAPWNFLNSFVPIAKENSMLSLIGITG